MSSSSPNTFNGLTYEQTINDLVFYHTLEVVATPTNDPNFQPTILEAFNPQQYVNSPNTAVGALNALFAGNATLSADGFLAQFNQFNLPGSWSSFATQLKTYNSALTDAQIASLENQFVSDYEYALRFPTSYANGAGVGSSEWDNVIRGLANQLTTSSDGIPTDADLQNAYNLLSASMKSQFEVSFSKYLQNYPYTQNSGSQVAVTASDLGLNFQKYLIASATLQDGTFSAQPLGSGSAGPAYQSYSSIYQSFFPPQSGDTSSPNTTYEQNYQNLLNTFINQEISGFNSSVKNGTAVSDAFIPSRAFADWAAFVKKTFQISLGSTSIPSASLAPLITQEFQTLLAQVGSGPNPSWLSSTLTNALPAQNLTQDLSNQIQYAYNQLDPNSNQLLNPNVTIPQNVIDAALYIRSVIRNTGVDIGTALQQLSSTNISALPAAAIAALNGLGVSTSTNVSAYQIQQLQYAFDNPNDTTVSPAVAAVVAAIKQQATTTVLNAVLNNPSSIWTGNIAGAQSGSGGPSSVDLDGSGHKLNILNNIFLLIVQMIGTLQNVAAAQSQRLTFLSTWTNAYVSLQNQLHSFYKGNGDYVDGSGAKDGSIYSPDFYTKGADSAGCGSLTQSNNVRDALNNTINANLSQVIQNNRGQVSDTSKAMQSTVNTTSDAVNQQSNMATTILQQLDSLLSAIFK